MTRVCLVSLFVAVPAFAQDKPAKTYPPDEATMKAIREKHKALVDAIAKLPESPFKPDVEVYAKAVEWVTRHEEYWDAKSGEKILAVLAAGQKRAEEIKDWVPAPEGAHKWTETDIPSWRKVLGKPVILGCKSPVDGSVQPFAVTCPPDFTPGKPYRRDVVLHGRDATLTEVKFIHGKESAKPPKDLGGFVQIDIYGRGNNAYRWAGEVDVYEAIRVERHGAEMVAFVRRIGELPAEPSAMILRGFSMGGAGTWHIGLHHPFSFSAIGPGAGFSVTKGYVK